MAPISVEEASCAGPVVSVRDRAVRRLKKRRDFHAHLLVYTLFNSSLVVVWFFTNRHGFFWPILLMAFWGIGLVMNAWDVYHSEDFSEVEIQREMRRMSS